MMELSFTYVPLLQNLYIETREDDSVPYLFEKVANDLPQLKRLVFQNTATSLKLSNVFKIGEVDVLGSLRQLALFLKYYTKLDLLALATVVLDVCPLLHKFSLSMEHSSTCDGKLAEKRVVRHHTQLKEVEFYGFNETENEYHFISYILSNVVFLQRLSIFASFKYRDLELGCWLSDSSPRVDEEKRRSIGRRLQGQAIAKNVEITIVQVTSLYEATCDL